MLGVLQGGGGPRGQKELPCPALPGRHPAHGEGTGLVAAGPQEIWRPAREATVMTLTSEVTAGPHQRPHAPAQLRRAAPGFLDQQLYAASRGVRRPGQPGLWGVQRDSDNPEALERGPWAARVGPQTRGSSEGSRGGK